MLYPSGFVGGRAPAIAAKNLGTSYRRLYVSVWLQLSANWLGPSYSALNRVFSVWAGGMQRVAFSARGRGSGPLVPGVQLLQTSDSRTRLDPNLVPGATVARGQWQRWEMVVTMNTPGVADGELHWWIGGIKIAEYRDVSFVGASESDTWNQLRWNPTWGISSDVLTTAMTMRWDDIYIGGSETRTTETPPPPPPPADSIPPSSTAIFSEGFESGTLAAWQDGVDPSKQRVITDASLAHSGTHVLEVTYPQGADGGWLTRFFMPGYDSLHVSAWVRLADNWVGATKLLALYGSSVDDQWPAFGKAGVCPNGSDFFATTLVTEPTGDPGPMRFYTYYPAMARQGDGVTCYGVSGDGSESYYPPMTLSRGAWHKIDFWVKLNAPGATDFDQKFWIDGVLRGDWHGISLRSTTDLRLNSVQLSFSYGNANNASPQAQQLYVDDIVVSTTSPDAPPPPPPPPPPPVATVTVTLSA